MHTISVGRMAAIFLLIAVLGGLLVELPVGEQRGGFLEQPVIEWRLPKYSLLQYLHLIANNVLLGFGTGILFDQLGDLIVVELPLLFYLEQLRFDAFLYDLEVFAEERLLHFLVYYLHIT